MKATFLIDKKIKKILNAKDPDEFFGLLHESNAEEEQKTFLTRQWLKATGYTRKDILRSKNKHPYWKERKTMNRNDRTKQRFLDNDYSNGTSRRWLEKDLKLFLKLNEDHTDIELAKKLGRSIPSIQGIRRRYNLGKKIVEASNAKQVDEERWLHFVSTDEKILRRELEEAIGGKKGKAKEAASAVSRGRKIKK